MASNLIGFSGEGLADILFGRIRFFRILKNSVDIRLLM